MALVLFCTQLFAIRVGDLEIRMIQENLSNRHHGYHEGRVEIKNLSNNEHHLKLAIDNGFGSSNDLSLVEKEIVVPAQASIKTKFYVPGVNMYINGGIKIWLNGKRSKHNLVLNSTLYQNYSHTNNHLVLISQRLNRDLLDTEMKGFRIVYSNQLRLHRSNLSVELWSDNWLSYTCYDSMILHESDWKSMSSGTRRALEDMVRAGGSVITIGDYSLPEGSRQVKVVNGRGDKATVYRYGFGQFMNVSDSEDLKLSEPLLRYFKRTLERTHYPFATNRVTNPNKVFPVVDSDVRVNFKGIFFLMLVFFIIVGPVNYIILFKKKRKIWLLWTIPLISFMFCLVIVVYSLFLEGLDAHSRVASFTLLDEGNKKATTLGMASYYSVLTPSDGLHFETNTEVISTDRNGYQSPSKGMSISKDQHLTTGWISSRLPAHFRLRKSEQRRERLNINVVEGKVQGVNGLGADVKKVFYRDQQNNVYFAENIVAGASFNMTKVNGYEKDPYKQLHSELENFIHDGRWYKIQSKKLEAWIKFLEPGMYVLEMDASPFVEEALQGVDIKKEYSLVLGSKEGF